MKFVFCHTNKPREESIVVGSLIISSSFNHESLWLPVRIFKSFQLVEFLVKAR